MMQVSDARIFVLATDSRLARKFICEVDRCYSIRLYSHIELCLLFKAHKLGMRYPKHLFLIYGTYESQWWAVEDDKSFVEEELNCNAEDRATVLEFSLAALHFEIPSSKTVSACALALIFLCTV